jgi:uncharacterized membrane protein
MDIYLIFKFLHVLSVIIWLGGGFALVILGVVADMQSNKEALGWVIEQVVFLSPRVFVPASLAALVFGLIAAYLQWGFASLWIVLGLIGFAATFLTGILILKPSAERISAMVAKEGLSDNVVAHGKELLSHVKFDYVVLFAVVFDMVLKPTISDWLPLLIIVVAIVVGGYFFLLPAIMGGRTAKARS